MTNSLEWQGKVGKVWADQADALDAMLAPMGDIGLAMMGDVDGQRILDIGCGAGDSSYKLARRGADVLGVDISDDLLDVARARCAGLDAEFIKGDAAKIAITGQIDQIYSRCGVMFFDEPLNAFKHIRSQVQKGTPMTLVAWGDAALNDWARLPVVMAKDVIDLAEPQNGEAGPFSWGDRADFEGMLKEAGWQNLMIERFAHKIPLALGDHSDGIDAGVEFLTTIGRLASGLKGTSPELRSDVRRALRERLGEYMLDGTVQMNAVSWLIKANA